MAWEALRAHRGDARRCLALSEDHRRHYLLVEAHPCRVDGEGLPAFGKHGVPIWSALTGWPWPMSRMRPCWPKFGRPVRNPPAHPGCLFRSVGAHPGSQSVGSGLLVPLRCASPCLCVLRTARLLHAGDQSQVTSGRYRRAGRTARRVPDCESYRVSEARQTQSGGDAFHHAFQRETQIVTALKWLLITLPLM